MNRLCIQNGEVVLPDRSLPGGTVILADGRIEHAGRARKTPRGADAFDARGGYVTPGLIDVHIHGAGPVGWETCTSEGLRQFDATMLAAGIVRYLPTMMASEQVLARVARLLQSADCADRVPGLYVEGPFISPEKRGGVQPEYVRPVDLAYMQKLQSIAGGRIRMMTFAPELQDADQLPPAMRDLNIVPCPGHSMATAAVARAVCGRRKVGCTHLYNAMTGLGHREPGLAAFALDEERVFAELNPDGTHVAPELLRLTYRAKAVDRLVLISDAVPSAGLPPGEYHYMDRTIRNTTGGVYYAEAGTLVGSSILLNEGVRRFMKHTGAPVHDAVRMATLNPARLLGLDRRTGSLEPGKSADVVVFSRNFAKARAVFCRGTCLRSVGA